MSRLGRRVKGPASYPIPFGVSRFGLGCPLGLRKEVDGMSVLNRLRHAARGGFPRRAAFYLVVTTPLLLVVLLISVSAQDDGGGYSGGDPGYGVYGDTGPYPTGDEPLPGLGNSSGGSDSSPSKSTTMGSNSGGGLSPGLPTQSPTNLFGSPSDQFTGPQSSNQTARGNYTPQQPASDTQSQPILTRPQSDPNSGIPAWVQNLGPNVSIDDSTKVQQLYQERNDLRQQVTKDPVGDLGTMIGDVITAGVTGQADQPPLAEERQQQRFRINEINQQLQQIFDRNNILASPYADDGTPQPSQQNSPPTPGNGNGGDFSVHASDSTPNGLGGAPAQKATPFDWQSGWQNRFQDS